MGYKLKRIMMRPNGEEKQVRPPVPPYLCFTANTANSTVTLNKTGTPTAVTLETSTDGTNRSTYTFGSTITLSNIGDKVYWRNTSETDTGFSTNGNNYYKFAITGSIAGSGNLSYLLNKNGTNVIGVGCFQDLFNGCTNLTSAPDIDVDTVGNYCCYRMFKNCVNLITAPKLTAINLAEGCYQSMFDYCINLDTLPKLAATTLPTYCYSYMFLNCSKIKLSTTQTGAYQTPYRIPTIGTGTAGSNAFDYMITNTGGTFTSNPTINTTYYTSNTVV